MGQPALCQAEVNSPASGFLTGHGLHARWPSDWNWVSALQTVTVSGSLHNPVSQFLRLNFLRIRERNRYRPRRFCLENPNTDFRKEKDVSCTILQVSLGRSLYLNTTLSPETPTYLKHTRLYYDLSLSFLCFMHCVANISLKLYKILLFAQL